MKDIHQNLRDLNNQITEEVIDFAKSLVQIPSPSLHEREIAEYIEQKMIGLGYDEVSVDHAGNVIGVIHGRHRGDSLLFASHMDTTDRIPSYSELHHQCEPRMKGRRLYGTGAANCKAGLASQVYAAILLKRAQVPLQGNLVVAATVADEGGLNIGVRELLKRTLPNQGIRPMFAMLGDSTDLGIYHGSDGWVQLDIRISSTSGRTVRDAAHAAVLNFQGGLGGTLAGDEEMFPIAIPVFSNNGDLFRADICLTRRLLAGDVVAELLPRIRDQVGVAVRPFSNLTVKIRIHEEEHWSYNGHPVTADYLTTPWFTDPNSYEMQRIRSAFDSAGYYYHLDQWHNKRLGIGSAGSVLANDFGIPTIGYGPGSEVLAQSANECVEIDKISHSVYGNAIIAHALAGVSDSRGESDVTQEYPIHV